MVWRHLLKFKLETQWWAKQFNALSNQPVMCSRGWKEYIQYDYLTIKEPDATRCYVAKVQYLQSQLANDFAINSSPSMWICHWPSGFETNARKKNNFSAIAYKLRHHWFPWDVSLPRDISIIDCMADKDALISCLVIIPESPFTMLQLRHQLQIVMTFRATKPWEQFGNLVTW